MILAFTESAAYTIAATLIIGIILILLSSQD